MPLQIQKPELKSATRLTPLQLNALGFDHRHTVLTPKRLARLKTK